MSVICVRKKDLNSRGINDFQAWLEMPDTEYIGRRQVYVKGTFNSKWKNPFSVKKYGREGCIKMYREMLLKDGKLMSELEELRGKELGCWCTPEKCHGDVLLELLDSQ
ncbi:hypothetical protein HDV01_006607 [Terramyces sp. JEL0728]|nr:hypothetical protein HDV01_006607 [Terramyces sp. JEL0728]